MTILRIYIGNSIEKEEYEYELYPLRYSGEYVEISVKSGSGDDNFMNSVYKKLNNTNLISKKEDKNLNIYRIYKGYVEHDGNSYNIQMNI
jgi:hypothetical protein